MTELGLNLVPNLRFRDKGLANMSTSLQIKSPQTEAELLARCKKIEGLTREKLEGRVLRRAELDDQAA